MANVDVLNLNGERVGSIELADALFAPDQINEALLWGGGEALPRFSAPGHGRHQELHRKSPVPARSCGSRRARAGHVLVRSARYCGVTVTPCTDRSRAATTITRFRAKKLLGALRSALASKLADGKLTVVDSLELAEGKTKLYRAVLDKLDVTRTALIVENGKTLSHALLLGTRNLGGRRAGSQQRGSSLRSAPL